MAFVAVGARSDHARHANTAGINGIIGSTVTVNGLTINAGTSATIKFQVTVN